MPRINWSDPKNRGNRDKAKKVLPPIDPASPTFEEEQIQNALQGKAVKESRTKLSGVNGKSGGKGERNKGAFKKGHTIQPLPGQLKEAKRLKPHPARVVQEMFQLKAPQALQALEEALGDPKLKVTAANSILDRGYGKAVQQVQLSAEIDGKMKSINVDMSAEEAARLYADTISAGALPVEAVRQLTHERKGGADPDEDNASGE